MATPPADLGPATEVSVANIAVCAIRQADSTVRCWGSNGRGQLNVPCGLGAVKTLSVGYNSVRRAWAAGGGVGAVASRACGEGARCTPGGQWRARLL